MDLDQLRAFIESADQGSFTQASAALGLSRVTLRQRIGALEAEVGVPLFVRDHSGITLSEAGGRLLDEARDLVQRADALIPRLQQVHEADLGELRLRAPTGMPPEVVWWLSDFIQRHHPQLRLRLHTCPDTLDPRSPPADVLLYFGEIMAKGAYRTFVMRTFRRCLLASPEYLAREGTPGSLEELSRHRMMVWALMGHDERRLPLLSGESLVLDPWFSTPDAFLVRSMAVAGRGIALLAEGQARLSVPQGPPLEPVLPHVVGDEIQVRVLLPEETADTGRSRAVVRLLRALAASYSGGMGR